MAGAKKTPPNTTRVAKWYMGGVASMGAACCTHPLDLIKVHLQTQQEGKKGMWQMAKRVVRSEGLLGLYNGLSASLVRQGTYSMTRFAMYETLKSQVAPGGGHVAFYQKALLAGFSGFCGGVVGTPGDLVNVRMQNDVKLPKEQRRNYKHALDGLWRVYSEEGFRTLFSGVTMASTRAVVVTIGQLGLYDQYKEWLLSIPFLHMKDDKLTHFTASLGAGTTATLISQPLDVFKTRMMNAKPGEFNSIVSLITYTRQTGLRGFFKGFLPAWIRLGPQTIITFMLFEQLRLRFGTVVTT